MNKTGPNNKSLKPLVKVNKNAKKANEMALFKKACFSLKVIDLYSNNTVLDTPPDTCPQPTFNLMKIV